MITRNSFSTKSISENSIGRATTASSDFWSKIAKIKQDFEERSKEEASKRVADLISKLPKYQLLLSILLMLLGYLSLC